MSFDWIICGASVEAIGSDRDPTANAVALSGSRIAAVGVREDLLSGRNASTETIEASDAAILPGFIDTHMHLEKIAIELDMAQLNEARSLEELLRIVGEATHSRPRHEWTLAYGDDNYWHERQLREHRLPTQADLDAVAPAKPVFLYRGPDRAVINSIAAQLLREELAELPDEQWDPRDGLISGSAATKLRATLPEPELERRREMLGHASKLLLEHGLTSVVDPGLAGRFNASWELYEAADARTQVQQHVYLMNRLDPRVEFGQEYARIENGPVAPGDQTNRLRAWAIKLILDGEFTDAWIDEPDGATIRYSVEELDAILALCARRSWPLCVHAVGTAAIGCVLDRLQAAIRDGAAFEPGQISLAHVFLPTSSELRECSALGVSVSVQPPLAHAYGPEIRAAWPQHRETVLPLRDMLEAGIVTAGGSDVLPFAPLHGAAIAITRRDRDDQAIGSESQALSREEALSLYTHSAGAYVGENVGKVAVGSRADLVLWPESPLRTPLDRWPQLRPLAVFVNGALTYSSLG